ncbi:GNAT family N-acetyltransferase [Streptomyces sp. NPDC087917]|uniref:GNAT family N-acetyltransferase n=1 Tax=Streptomyces sp. NPDC087917 TaxID=3155060 RepID=UPI0034409990
MSDTHVLRVTRVRADDETALLQWHDVHNLVIPPDPLTPAEVRERSGRNRLYVARLGDTPVGCSTVRPPTPANDSVATVIARVLTAHRRRGHGAALYAHGLRRARALAPAAVETIVLASNGDGLRFALAHGFTETDRYLLPGADVAYVTLRLTDA